MKAGWGEGRTEDGAERPDTVSDEDHEERLALPIPSVFPSCYDFPNGESEENGLA